MSAPAAAQSAARSDQRPCRDGRAKVAGQQIAPAQQTTTAQIASDTARNLANNALANTGRGATSTGAAGQHFSGNDGAAFRLCPFWPGQHAARGQSPKSVRRVDDLVQSRAGRIAQRSDGGGRRSDAPTRHAGFDPRQLSRARPQVFQQSLAQRAAADRCGAARRLYRARRALRELCPSDHDPVDPALGRGRRGAGADRDRLPSSA